MQKGIVQSVSGKIEKELDTKCIIIYGKPRNGKTILAATIGYESYRKRIYANFNIYKNGISINKRFNSFKEIYNIQYSDQHGVIIVDETGINANSKDSFSETSRMLQEVLFLSGKKNCDMIMIAQSYESVDVNFRRNAAAIFECVKVKRYGRTPLFKVNRVVPDGLRVRKIGGYTIDTLSIMNLMRISYDTLEESKMDEKIVKKQQKAERLQKQIDKKEKNESMEG